MNNTELVGIYQQLADVTQQTLLAMQARDWEAYSALQEREEALVHSLKNYCNMLQSPAVLAQLIHEILNCQKEVATLISIWRAEIACEIDSTTASRLLTQKYYV